MYIDIDDILAVLNRFPGFQPFAVETANSVAGVTYGSQVPPGLSWIDLSDDLRPRDPQTIETGTDATYWVRAVFDRMGRPFGGRAEVTSQADPQQVRLAIVQAFFGPEADLELIGVFLTSHGTRATHWLHDHFDLKCSSRGDCVQIDGQNVQLFLGVRSDGPLSMRSLIDCFGYEILESAVGRPQLEWLNACSDIRAACAFIVRDYDVHISGGSISMVRKGTGNGPQFVPIGQLQVSVAGRDADGLVDQAQYLLVEVHGVELIDQLRGWAAVHRD